LPAFNAQLAILQRGAKTSESTSNQLIESGTPSFGGPLA
jgi:hypothetical protein